MRRLSLLCLLALFIAAAPTAPANAQNKKKHKVRWMNMELGSVFTSTINNIPKGIAVRVGDNGEAGVLYDEDLVRMAYGWQGNFVNIGGGRDGLLANDSIGGRQLFETARVPGWVKGDGEFKDPRPKKYGTVDSIRYKGLYMHGKRVVLKYQAAGVDILESPWVTTSNGLTVFTRDFEVGKRDTAMRVMIANGQSNPQKLGSAQVAGPEKGDGIFIAVAGGGGKATLTKGDKLIVDVAAGGPVKFRVLIAKVSGGQRDAFAKVVASDNGAVDLTALTKGGPKQWKETVTTKSTLGKGKGAYVVDTIQPPFKNPYNAILHFAGVDFFSNGNAALCTMEGDVWLVSGIKPGDKLGDTTWQRIATGLYHPLGLKIVKDKIHLACRDQIAKLHDLNGDNEIDFYECFNNDIKTGTNGHEFATCLETDPQGNFYFMKGNNGGQTSHDASAIKVSADGKTLTRFATGFRWPNGMGMSPTGLLSAADQQGTWIPSSRVDIVELGGFYGFMNSHHRKVAPKTYDGPLCWIPHKVDNSCGGQVWVESDKWGPLSGQMLHLSYGKCTLFNMVQEKLEGVPGKPYQGGAIQFPFKFATGVCRGRFSKHDGQLYLTGLKGWQTSGPYDGGLQRVRYTGKPVNMPVGLTAHKNGMKITFTDALDKELAEDATSYDVEHWNYRWTKGYGSREYKVSDPSKVGHDKLTVKSAKLSSDGKTVFIEIEGIVPVMQMSIKYDLESKAGEEVRNSIYNTIHKLGPAVK